MRKVAEGTPAQAMSPVVSSVCSGARVVFNANDSTGIQAESAMSLPFADNPQASSNVEVCVILRMVFCVPPLQYLIAAETAAQSADGKSVFAEV